MPASTETGPQMVFAISMVSRWLPELTCRPPSSGTSVQLAILRLPRLPSSTMRRPSNSRPSMTRLPGNQALLLCNAFNLDIAIYVGSQFPRIQMLRLSGHGPGRTSRVLHFRPLGGQNHQLTSLRNFDHRQGLTPRGIVRDRDDTSCTGGLPIPITNGLVQGFGNFTRPRGDTPMDDPLPVDIASDNGLEAFAPVVGTAADIAAESIGIADPHLTGPPPPAERPGVLVPDRRPR